MPKNVELGPSFMSEVNIANAYQKECFTNNVPFKNEFFTKRKAFMKAKAEKGHKRKREKGVFINLTTAKSVPRHNDISRVRHYRGFRR